MPKAPLFSGTSTLLNQNGDPIMKVDAVQAIVVNEPNRITYEHTSNTYTNYKNVCIDGQYSGYVRCFLCIDKLKIQKQGSANMLMHKKRHHPETCNDGAGHSRNKNRKGYSKRTDDEIHRLLLKAAAAREMDGNADGDEEPLFYCFAPTGQAHVNRIGAVMGAQYQCCYCDHETSMATSNMKSHIVHYCPGVPDDVRDAIKRSKCKRHWKEYIGLDDGDDSDADDGLDVVNDPNGGLNGNNQGDAEDGDDGNDQGLNDTDKAVKILTNLLDADAEDDGMCKKEDKDLAMDILNRNRKEDAKETLKSVEEMDAQIKDLKYEKLKNEIKEMEIRIKSEEINLQIQESVFREKELKMRENEEKLKCYQNLNQRIDKLISAGEVVFNSMSSDADGHNFRTLVNDILNNGVL